MSPLGENHRRTLLAAFTQMDKLLLDIESAARARSPLSTISADLAPVQEQVIADYVGRIRERVKEALARLGIALPAPRTTASWAIQTSLSFAQVALAEVSPSRLRGYGALADEDAALLASVEADLARLVRALHTYVAQGLGRDLSARLARLEQAPIDPRLLRVLERVVRERGLIEYRAALESLLEHLESRTFEIAVFGRVSSGKSTLLNTIVGVGALPVGVTPVTAVPTRLTFGNAARVIVRFADAPEREVALEELPAYVSEQGNPRNEKQVVRALVELPSRALREGIVFVDTPGVGSLAAAGGRESYAYFPRCDLGILLVDGASAPSPEDLEIVRLLYESGIPARVVVSKADLLSEGDRTRMREYLQSAIAARLGIEAAVGLVSAVGDGAIAHRWFESEIVPLYDKTQELREASLRRKLAALREGVVASLRAELGARPREAADGHEVGDFALAAERALEEGARRCEEAAEEARTLAARAAARAAEELVLASDASPAEEIRRSILRTAEPVRTRIREALQEARERLTGALAGMAQRLGLPLDEEPLALDLVALPALSVPREVETFTAPSGRWGRERRIAHEIERTLGDPLTRAFAEFGTALRVGSQATLARLAQEFTARSEPLRAQAKRRGTGGGADAAAVAADLREVESL
jgi:GTP-binding protein EngB required for normal cell division